MEFDGVMKRKIPYYFTYMAKSKKDFKQMNKQNNENKFIDPENILVVARGGKRWGVNRMSEGISYMVMYVNEMCGGDHLVVYTDVKLE